MPLNPRHRAPPENTPLATPNFAFQKRQKELEKKRKAEEKQRLKLARKQQAANPAPAPEEGTAADADPGATPAATPPEN